MTQLKAGFAEVDITPEPGVEKAGWLNRIVAESILDPIFAKALVLESSGTRVGFVALDLLSVRRSQVRDIRALAGRCGIPPAHLMVSAVHNHAGPAIVSVGDTKRDDRYVAVLMGRIEEALRRAVALLGPARLGVATMSEGRISFIRRYVMKDGSTMTHPPKFSPQIRHAEGVIDPELGVVGIQDGQGRWLGFAVNFACHPCHHGGDTCISAGYPGCLSRELKGIYGAGCVTVFLNGAFGDIQHSHPFMKERYVDMEHMGRVLAEDVQGLASGMTFENDVRLRSASAVVKLALRDIDGRYGLKAPHRQLQGRERIFADAVEKLRRKKAQKDYTEAEVQCLRIGGDTAFVGIPAELFVEFGLKIKKGSPAPRTFIVGGANGMVGYVPTRAAIEGGGYEASISMTSKLVPEAGDLLAAKALELLGGSGQGGAT